MSSSLGLQTSTSTLRSPSTSSFVSCTEKYRSLSSLVPTGQCPFLLGTASPSPPLSPPHPPPPSSSPPLPLPHPPPLLFPHMYVTPSCPFTPPPLRPHSPLWQFSPLTSPACVSLSIWILRIEGHAPMFLCPFICRWISGFL